MVVIIPNPNDQLTLVKLQQQLCKQYKDNAEYLCKNFPLWIPVPHSEKITAAQLKDFSKSISKVQILSLDSQLNLQIEINIEKNTEYTQLKLLQHKGLKKISPQKINSVSLKKFRIGIVNQVLPNTVSITDSVWVKL